MDAKRDQNHVTSMLFVGSDGLTYPVEGDEATGRILVDNSGGGSGTVTSVSVTSANGFAGTVATATTTPAITLSTTINAAALAGNGTAIAAATTTGTGSTVVLNTSPTLVTPILGTPASGTLTNTTGFPVANLAGAGTGVLTFLATPSSANLASALTDETGTGVAVFNNSPTFADDITIGVAGSATGSILMKGTTSGTVTIKTADAAGTWTLTSKIAGVSKTATVSLSASIGTEYKIYFKVGASQLPRHINGSSNEDKNAAKAVKAILKVSR